MYLQTFIGIFFELSWSTATSFTFWCRCSTRWHRLFLWCTGGWWMWSIVGRFNIDEIIFWWTCSTHLKEINDRKQNHCTRINFYLHFYHRYHRLPKYHPFRLLFWVSLELMRCSSLVVHNAQPPEIYIQRRKCNSSWRRRKGPAKTHFFKSFFCAFNQNFSIFRKLRISPIILFTICGNKCYIRKEFRARMILMSYNEIKQLKYSSRIWA